MRVRVSARHQLQAMEMNVPSEGRGRIHDRALLLHGSKRNEILTLTEVRQYGVDSFADPDYIRLYGMTPAEWYSGRCW
jgi:hypothetical protein